MKESEVKAMAMVLNYLGLLVNYETAKKCAVISVEEIIKLPSIHDGRMIAVIPEDYQFWQDVRQEIIKL